MLVLGLLLLPPSRKWFESKINKKIPRLVALGVGTVLFVVAMVAYPTHSNNTKQIVQDNTKDTNTVTNQVANTNTAATTNTNQAEVTPVVVEPVKEEPKPEPTTLDKLWIALDDSIKTRDGYDVKWDEEYKTAYLTRTQDTFLNEHFLVEGVYQDLVRFGQAAFKIDGVEYVDISYKLPFIDEFGTKTINTAVGLQMKKETFEKFNWDNLKFTPIYKTMQDNAEYQVIMPSIRAGLVESELLLKF